MADVRTEMAEVRTDMANLRTDVHELAAATNRRLATVVLGATGLLITAGGVMTTLAISALR